MKIESVWLKGKGRFLLGSFQPSIADLSLVCEIMQLEVKIYACSHFLYDQENKFILKLKSSSYNTHFRDVSSIRVYLAYVTNLSKTFYSTY